MGNKQCGIVPVKNYAMRHPGILFKGDDSVKFCNTEI